MMIAIATAASAAAIAITKIEKYKQDLKAALEKEGIEYSNKFYFFGYNAPFEIFNRKNEVLVEINPSFKQ